MDKTLDLHKVKHAEAYNLVVKFIEYFYNTGETLTIITGHSPVMRQLVIGILEDYELDYKIGGVLEIDNSFINVYDV